MQNSLLTIFLSTMKMKPNVLFSIISFCFLSNTLHVLSTQHYSHADSYIVNCGSTSAETDADGRTWEPDAKYLSSPNNQKAYKAEYKDPALPSTVPYMTAMVFKSTTTYSFPIKTKGRHWVRLHFYPSSYNNVNTIQSYFSVSAAGITLLKKFCPGFSTQPINNAVIVTEFSLYINSNELDITFMPLTFQDSDTHAFALINGIEVISTPDIFLEPALLRGYSDPFIDTRTSTVQAVYRLNVGGQFIPGSKDSTGLSRTWYDDSRHLDGRSGVPLKAYSDDRIEYPTTVPTYIAPRDVYSTARSMGSEAETYNLTWTLNVEPHYPYIIRLHFCELEWTKVNQRVFNIYLNNLIIVEGADVIEWAGAKDVPYYKDFAILSNDSEEISVTLRPSAETRPQVSDAILNGLEVFKVFDFSS